MWKLGDILEASDRSFEKGRHYIIYLEGLDQYNFIGGMITHSDKFGNLSMNQGHFETIDNDDNECKVGYDNTYLVLGKFIKPNDWGPFTKVGQLTNNGIHFINENILNLEHTTFELYVNLKLYEKN